MGRSATGEIAELLERSQQLALLADRLADVTARSHGRVVLISGEAGIGKTALLRRFCADQGKSVRVLWAACDPLFTPRPLGPLLDLARLIQGALQEQVESGARPHDVAAALLRELESPAPTVLVLEDLHWADEATLDVVRLLAGRVGSVPALVVASYRDDQLHRTHPLRIVLGELPGGDVVRRVHIETLSREAVGTLSQASEIDADELFARTAGNPFFVTEALAAEMELLPPTVRDAVLARAARLTPTARSLLDAVAVVPQRVEVWLLEALATSALDALDECLASGILRGEADGVVFRHELARLAVEEAVAPDRAVVLHRRALDALAEPAIGAPDLARLAHHAEGAGDADAVLRFAPAAAEQALALNSPREAQRQYARALRFAGGLDDVSRADLLVRYAEVGYLTDMRAEAVEALCEALTMHRARGDLVKQGEDLRLRARLHVCAGRMGEARADVLEAVALLEQAPPGRELARAYSTLSGVAMFVDDAEQTTTAGELAIELAERVGDVEALVSALNSVGTIELLRAIPAGREKLERSLELAVRADLDQEVGRAYINLSYVLGRSGDWRLGDRYLDKGSDFCRERGLEAWLTCLRATGATSDLAQGRWDQAAATAAAIIETGQESNIGPVVEALVVLALVRARRGDPDYRPLLDRARAIADGVDDLQYLALVACARAEVAWLEGRLDAIASETDAAYALASERGERSFTGELGVWRARAELAVDPQAETFELHRLELEGHAGEAARLWAEKGCRYQAALALAGADDAAALRHALGALQGWGRALPPRSSRDACASSGSAA